MTSPNNKIWDKVEELRLRYKTLKSSILPIDIFVFVEIDLCLNVIPFKDLYSKYQIDAAINVDFTGIYIDSQEYENLNNSKEWKLKRLRFTIAHEIGHYFLHQNLIKILPTDATPFDFFKHIHHLNAHKYNIEKEANEFAGRLLVPVDRLKERLDIERDKLKCKFAKSNLEVPNAKQLLAKKIAPTFDVNWKVIETRFDREGLCQE